ncbi:MAG: hypothetical protein ACLUEK_10450 [Oscillospiraceae bacterium]
MDADADSATAARGHRHRDSAEHPHRLRQHRRQARPEPALHPHQAPRDDRRSARAGRRFGCAERQSIKEDTDEQLMDAYKDTGEKTTVILRLWKDDKTAPSGAASAPAA